MHISSKFTARNVQTCAPRYSEEEREAEGRMRVLFKRLDPEYPDAIDCFETEQGEMKTVRNRINKVLNKSGISCKMLIKDNGFDAWGCKLTQKYMDEYGVSYNPLSDELMHDISNECGLHDFVEVAKVINEVFDDRGLLGDVDNIIVVPAWGGREELTKEIPIRRVKEGSRILARQVSEPGYADLAWIVMQSEGADVVFFADVFHNKEKGGRPRFWKDLQERRDKEFRERKMTLEKAWDKAKAKKEEKKPEPKPEDDLRERLMKLKFGVRAPVVSAEDEGRRKISQEYVERRRRKVRQDG